MTDTVVVEGQVRLRDGKKWKNRWVALRKPSPVADCLSLLVYKEKGEKSRGARERSNVTLGDICGLEPGPGYDGVGCTLAIVCLAQTVTLGFDRRDALQAWDARLRYSLGEVHRFSVSVQPGTKLEHGPATLHLCNNVLVITRDLPPVVIGQWKLSDLRRYGAVPNGFVFEGGTRCGYWAGVFFLACVEGEQISFLFDCIVRGISPTKSPFGLQPVLPDPNASPASAEERIQQEACDLEKRLSLLSTCSRQSSTASTCSYSSVAGDDRSMSSSSSEASHSDGSLAMWAEPTRCPAPTEPASFPAPTTKSVSSSASADDRLYAAVMGVGHPPWKAAPRPRGLQDAGRQSSTDSGIATGSHSSYSGSFSSYAGSLELGQGESSDFGSLLSLGNVASQNAPGPERGACLCPPREPPQPRGTGSEYQVPGLGRQRYDTPRSLLLLQGEARGASVAAQDRRPSGGSQGTEKAPAEAVPKRAVPHKAPWSGEAAAPPGGPATESCTPRSLATSCPVCGGIKAGASPPAGVSPAPTLPDKSPKWRQGPCSAGVSYEIKEGLGMDKTSEAEERSRYELMGSYGQQRVLRVMEDPKGNYERMAFTTDTHRRTGHTSREYGGLLALPSGTDRSLGDGVTYVNIPMSPTSKRQLHYMELGLQDLTEPNTTVRGGGSTKYAHIDIAATETAQRTGAQHALGREERLQELELRRKAALP